MKKFLLMIIIFLCMSSTVFGANDWDMTTYKQTVDTITSVNFLDYLNYEYTGGITDYTLSQGFWESVLPLLEEKLEATGYLQSDYPYAYVNFGTGTVSGTTRTLTFHFCTKYYINSTLVSYGTYSYRLQISVTVENNVITSVGNVSRVQNNSSSTNSYYYYAQNGSYGPNTMILTPNMLYGGSSPCLNVNMYNYIDETPIVNNVDLSNLTVNEYLNNDLIIGKNFSLTQAYYYYSGDEKIDISNYISSEVVSNSSYYQSINYISRYNKQYLPTDKNIYYEYTLNSTGEWTYSRSKSDILVAITNTGGDTSGDTGGDTGGNTGDYTGQLNQIQGNLNNIENKIPTSGDIEQATQNGVMQGNTNYWGTSGDMESGDFSGDINGLINGVMNSSGELTKGEIFGALEQAEAGFIKVITEQPDDFKLEWQEFKLENVVLIPAGEINFSALAREDETFGLVKQYLNTISSAFLGFHLIAYLWNLVLATLGIDNPYLYEQPLDEVNTVAYDTDVNSGITTETRTTRKRDGTTFRIRRRF